MSKTPLTTIIVMGRQATFIRGVDAATYSPTRPSLKRLSRILRWFIFNHSDTVSVLPFLDGWTAVINPSYHEAGRKKLNINDHEQKRTCISPPQPGRA